MDGPAQPWNINIHYDRLLDVGCGDGFLSARLDDKGCDVVALDADAGVLDRAQRRWPDHRIHRVHTSLLDHDLAPGSFDVVVSNAMLHQLPDTTAALKAMAGLLRPGGMLCVVGFARNGPADWPMTLVGSVGIFAAVRLRGKWEHTAPIAWQPPHTYGQMRTIARRSLPGCTYQRLWLGRYLLT